MMSGSIFPAHQIHLNFDRQYLDVLCSFTERILDLNETPRIKNEKQYDKIVDTVCVILEKFLIHNLTMRPTSPHLLAGKDIGVLLFSKLRQQLLDPMYNASPNRLVVCLMLWEQQAQNLIGVEIKYVLRSERAPRLAMEIGETYNPNTFTCFNFVFHQLNEQKARGILFKGSSSWPEELVENPFKFLNAWGYEQIAYPENGCIALYWEKNHTRDFHYALYFEGSLYSKMGTMTFVTKHKMECITTDVGNSIYFFRKMSTSPMTETLRENSKAIVHKEFSSGSLIRSLQLLIKDAFKRTFPTPFRDSIYGEQYNSHLRKKLKCLAECDLSYLKEIPIPSYEARQLFINRIISAFEKAIEPDLRHLESRR